MLPGLLLVGLVAVPPVLAVLVLSLFRIELMRDDVRRFAGLSNFLVRLPADGEFLATIPRTLVFAFLATATAAPIALGAALLVNGRRRGASALGLLLLVPWAVAPVAAGVFFRLLFDSKFGLVNDAMVALGVAPVRWLDEALLSLVVTLIAVVWRAIPLLAVLLLGALRAVPPSLGRAARMDGASAWQVLRHVTLPAVRPTVIVVCVIQVVLSLQVFDVLFAITRGRPLPGGDLTGYAIYSSVIGNLSFGYGSAQTVSLAAIVALCLLALVPVLRGTRVRRSRGTGDPDLDPFADSIPVGGLPPARWEVDGHGAESSTRGARVLAGRRARLRAWRGAAGRIARGVAIVALLAWLVGPVVWLLIASVQPESALRASPPALTLNLTLDGYARLLGDPTWSGALVVSVTVAAVATAIAVVVGVLAGYPLARYPFRGARVVLVGLLLTQLIPPIALAIPVLFLVLAVGLKGTVAGLVMVNAAFWTPILVWLVRAAFLAVPRSLESAARIDGAGRLGAMFRIALPAAGPGIAAAAVIVFVGVWNDFVFVAILGSRATTTLPRYLTISSDPPYHVLAAGILLTLAPCLALVALLHRRILRAV